MIVRRPARHALALAAVVVGLLLPAAGSLGEVGDVVMKRAEQTAEDVPVSYFPHWIHRMQYKCGACHDEPFKMKAGASEITMDAIQAGQSCGVCHNGKAAFESNFDTCQRCHYK